jgi:hypothetical protein
MFAHVVLHNETAGNFRRHYPRPVEFLRNPAQTGSSNICTASPLFSVNDASTDYAIETDLVSPNGDPRFVAPAAAIGRNEGVLRVAVPSQAVRTFKIGRAPDCDIVLADDSVSRHHAELLLTAHGQLFLSDCQSTHGTEIIERGVARRVEQEFLGPSALLKFGDVSMPLTELIQALRARFPEIAFPGAPAAAPERESRRWEKGTRLVRCACGSVKPKGQRCQECGE